MRTLVWFRGKDLRVADHAPLTQAAAAGEVLPVFVLDPYFFAPERARELPHRMQFLLESLRALAANLEHLGSRLILVAGPSVDLVPRLALRWKVDQVLAHRWVEPFGRKRDCRIQEQLDQEGIPFHLFEGETLLPPGSVRNGQGGMYRVFTPFGRACGVRLHLQPPLPVPKRLPPLPVDVAWDAAPLPTLEDLGLVANPRLQPGGEHAALGRLKAFLAGPIDSYASDRNRMDRAGTSRLSADLKFGTLSVAKVWQAAAEHQSAGPFLNELLWREFSHHLLWEWPHLLQSPFRTEFHGFPWAEDAAAWAAWIEGRTGYPVVDAAARQLLQEGFVHNRARMVAASFLAKHLLLDFRLGEAHYLRWLTDGDWAQNDAGWQWNAGCGCDAQPWFRIFNPVTQGLKFDPEGDYVRRWVPELSSLPKAFIQQPWKAPAALRANLDYPDPIVDHAFARARFLAVARSHLGRGTPT
jgi:deoxyribodipyrimidine photo-lyase